MDIDPLLVSRLQFAFTIIFHITFPAFTIGLSAYIATLRVIWMRTGKQHYREIARFWTKIFAAAFAMPASDWACSASSLASNSLKRSGSAPPQYLDSTSFLGRS